MRHKSSERWSDYVSTFHNEQPGITEDILSLAVSARGMNPYQWVTAPIPLVARTLDLACGSGPCMRLRRSEQWIGIDRSANELARSRASGAGNVLQGEATALPFDDAMFDGVVCSMAIMVLQPLDKAVQEVFRVLRPGGLFVVMMPGRHPVRVRDVVRYARLVVGLRRHRLTYPNERVLRGDLTPFQSLGFEVIEDVRLGFRLNIDTPETAERFVRSLYLPESTSSAMARAQTLVARWVGSDIGIPLRRITMSRGLAT
jgi:SAM-dependent methyltransferase